MSQAHSISPASPTVSIINGRPATTSLEVAKFFGKRHDDVLKSIRSLCANCPEEFTARNFAVSEYVDETGRSLVMFILYFDGFILLAMGYTGKKAMQIKLAYIIAFNDMREKLDKLAAEERTWLSAEVKALPQTTTPSTAEDRKPLRALVYAWSQLTGVHHAALWSQVKAHFQLSRIDDLPAEWVPDALDFVQGKIDGAAAQKSLPAAQPGRLPIYRNGCFYPPRMDKKHVPGPHEAALVTLWNDWSRRSGEVERGFNSLIAEIREHEGDIMAQAVAKMGQDAPHLLQRGLHDAGHVLCARRGVEPF